MDITNHGHYGTFKISCMVRGSRTMDISRQQIFCTSCRRLCACALGIIFNDPLVRRLYPKPSACRRLNICPPASVSKLPTQSSTNILHFVPKALCLCVRDWQAYHVGQKARQPALAGGNAQNNLLISCWKFEEDSKSNRPKGL
jgi:hypothetical protein